MQMNDWSIDLRLFFFQLPPLLPGPQEPLA